VKKGQGAFESTIFEAHPTSKWFQISQNLGAIETRNTYLSFHEKKIKKGDRFTLWKWVNN
jgi:hypothetical protein